MGKYVKLSLNYHQIPILSVPLLRLLALSCESTFINLISKASRILDFE